MDKATSSKSHKKKSNKLIRKLFNWKSSKGKSDQAPSHSEVGFSRLC